MDGLSIRKKISIKMEHFAELHAFSSFLSSSDVDREFILAISLKSVDSEA